MTTPTDAPTVSDPAPANGGSSQLWGMPRKVVAGIAAAALLLILAVAVPAMTRSSCDKLEALDAKLTNASRNEEDDHAAEYSELLTKCLDEQAKSL